MDVIGHYAAKENKPNSERQAACLLSYKERIFVCVCICTQMCAHACMCVCEEIL